MEFRMEINEDIKERFNLVVERVEAIKNEATVQEQYRDCFGKMADFIIFVNSVLKQVDEGAYRNLSIDELKDINDRMFGELRGDNYESSYGNPVYALKICGEEYSPESLCAILEKDIKYYQKSGGGVTFSGGEPLLQSEFVFECVNILRKKGIFSAVETASNVPGKIMCEAVSKFSLFMCDIKAMDPELHRSLTGVTNERILSNIKMIADMGAKVLVRIPVAMGLNGTDENITATAEFMREAGLSHIELLKLHNLSEHKYLSLGLKQTHPNVLETTDDDVEHFYGIFKKIIGSSIKCGL